MHALSHRPVPAVGHDDGAGDVGRQIRGEEDRRPDHVLRLAGAAERRSLHRKPRNVGIVAARLRVERRLDQPGPDRVDAHAVFAELGGARG